MRPCLTLKIGRYSQVSCCDFLMFAVSFIKRSKHDGLLAFAFELAETKLLHHDMTPEDMAPCT